MEKERDPEEDQRETEATVIVGKISDALVAAGFEPDEAVEQAKILYQDFKGREEDIRKNLNIIDGIVGSKMPGKDAIIKIFQDLAKKK